MPLRKKTNLLWYSSKTLVQKRTTANESHYETDCLNEQAKCQAMFRAAKPAKKLQSAEKSKVNVKQL